MADIELIYSTTTFKETALNNGSIANGITITVKNGTFAGDNGDSLLLKNELGKIVNVVGVPAGLTPVLVKTSATTARLTFKGTAEAHENADDITLDSANLVLSFDEFQFATGTGGGAVPEQAFAIDFNNKVTTGLTLVPEAGADTTAVYSAGSKTNTFENLPTISGTGTKGDKIYIYSNGGTKPLDATKAVTVADNGTWTLDLSTLKDKFKDGAHIVTASTSADGKGAMSAPFAFTVDSKAPSAPSVTVIKGAISDVTPVLTGKAEKGATVKVYSSDEQRDNAVGDKAATLLGETVADAKGIWTLAVDSDNTLLTKDGGYKISALAIDAAGNQTASKVQAKDNLIIDTTIAQSTLVVDTAKTKGNTVALTGATGEKNGGTVQLYGGEDGSLALGKVIKLDKEGNWKTSLKLSEGKHMLSVIVTDAAGNVSDNSIVLNQTIDTATAVPTLELAETEGKDWVTMYGTAEAGATVTVKNGTATLGETKADSTGKWVLDTSAITAPTKDGTTKLTATAKDTAGNISKASTAEDFKVNTKFEDKAAPTLLFAETSADGKTVVLTYSQALATVTAEASAYAVKVGSAANTVTKAETSGAKVTLTLTDAIKAGDAVTLTYTAPTETDVKADDKAIQDKTGNNAITLTDQAVTNLVPATEESGGGGGADTTAPAFVSAETNAEGTKVILTYGEDLGGTAPDKGAFTVLSGTAGSETANTVTGVTVVGSTVELTLTTAITTGQAVKVGYTAPPPATGTANAAIQDAAGNDAVTLAATTTVSNTVGAPADTTAPTISAFTVTDGTTLSMTSSEAGTAGLYNDTGNVLITGTDGAVTATTPKAITVAAQASMTTASLKVSDGATPVNTTTSPIKVLLGTAGGDGGADFTVGAGDQYIFTFAGNDTVTLTSAAASGRVIADFTAGGDKIALTGTAFVGITDDGSLLQAADFSSGAGKVAAASATEFIIYDTDTGNLYYDAGGNAGAAAVLIAKLVGSPDTLAATDFLVV